MKSQNALDFMIFLSYIFVVGIHNTNKKTTTYKIYKVKNATLTEHDRLTKTPTLFCTSHVLIMSDPE